MLCEVERVYSERTIPALYLRVSGRGVRAKSFADLAISGNSPYFDLRINFQSARCAQNGSVRMPLNWPRSCELNHGISSRYIRTFWNLNEE